MDSRVDFDTGSAALYAPAALPVAPVLLPEDELETPPLPRDHPKWVQDAVAVSARARRLLRALKPIVLRVLTFWDHRRASLTIEGRTLSVDGSGSYRLE